jgi:hypothetical protein
LGARAAILAVTRTAVNPIPVVPGDARPFRRLKRGGELLACLDVELAVAVRHVHLDRP